MLEILLAVVAGVLTIAAPCIILPLPILFGTSVGHVSKTRPLFITLGFVLAFATLGLSLNFLVQNLMIPPNGLRNGAAVVLAVFGVFMLWPRPFEILTSHLSRLITRASQFGQGAGTGNFGGFIIGIIIGIVWAPCAGPILGTILTLVAQEQDLGRAAILLVAYAIGAGMPMLVIAYGGQALTTKVRVIAQYSHRIQQIFGVLIILLAIAIIFQYDTYLQAKLLNYLPIFNPKF